MSFSIADRLLRREISDPYRPSFHTRSILGARGGNPGRGASSQTPKLYRYSSIRGLYGDKTWINDLDIVNELGGHTGCVNALSWSKSGRLLASGSDDTHLNIHKYNPEHSDKPFSLATTISTGHSANIFSVKFMPHSNDGTLISCAGDDQVRIFDIERNGQAASAGHIMPSSGRHHSGVDLEQMYKGVPFLTPATTNARVYRSHNDRVKRIITESSPHFFLTCSEDGEVRQWDLRLPSSAYPAARRGQPPPPPPLITYKRYKLDLNTISCSANQPHYIVLGGAHLHAFLHDRRMLGRDIDAERGQPAHRPSTPAEEDRMNQATRCVRRFAPNGKSKMKRTDDGHITACKISDANPNEMIASWSGDHIYSFDLIRSPDALERQDESSSIHASHRRKTSSKETAYEKKRKRGLESRQDMSDSSPQASHHVSARARSSSPGELASADVALRVRYGNGQSEDIPLEDAASLQQARQRVLTESQQRCLSIAKSVSRIRKLIFSDFTGHLQQPANSAEVRRTNQSVTRPLNEALSRISTVLPEMEEISRAWSYPILPSAEVISLQQGMRADRALSCHFLQSVGSVCRLLGATIRTLDPTAQSDACSRFSSVPDPPSSSSPWQNFCFTFLAAVVAWASGGEKGLIDRFKRPSRLVHELVLPSESDESAIWDHIVPHLWNLVRTLDEEHPIVDVTASRFETDNTRVLFESPDDAVRSLEQAIEASSPENIAHSRQFYSELLGEEAVARSDGVQDTHSILDFWKCKVTRGLLHAAGQNVNFGNVNAAFGGPRVRREPSEGRSQKDINVTEREESVQQMHIVGAGSSYTRRQNAQDRSESEPESDGLIAANDLHAVMQENGITVAGGRDEIHFEESDSDMEFSVVNSEDDDNDSDDATNHHINDDDDDDDDDDDLMNGLDEDSSDHDDGSENTSDSDTDMDPRMLFTAAGAYGRLKEAIEMGVPCSSHTRTYVGHCNVKTVKDVNFFGLEDEYIVSGSDSGHFFIWDRKSGKLLNVLQGDGEVVNVIQGHPYEPLLAVSGIDHTIKIFSPDFRAQSDARHGINLSTSAHRSHGVSRLMRDRLRRERASQRNTRDTLHQNDLVSGSLANSASAATAAATRAEEDDDDDIDAEEPTNGGLASCKRIKDSYQIMSQNDADRRGGMEDAVMTRGFLAQLAAHIQTRRRAARAAGGGLGDDGDDYDDDDDDESRAVTLSDDCTVM